VYEDKGDDNHEALPDPDIGQELFQEDSSQDMLQEHRSAVFPDNFPDKYSDDNASDVFPDNFPARNVYGDRGDDSLEALLDPEIGQEMFPEGNTEEEPLAPRRCIYRFARIQEARRGLSALAKLLAF